ncbi:hypothetical protein HOLleu_19443 [Holothuria leucospilota]|uniref:Uncharacterized protein n=1 Tax=Holothuria leucospilota TaxID=206669 RepID=A0A9Q1C027_HOLLE|nr:hypothetical protein HOLleu_19443 [Holothuria leucospilota]
MGNPNDGPIQLAHDPTPKDLTQSKPVNELSLSGSYRFQGYPNGYFVDARKPLLGKPAEIPDQYHRKRQHFVKGQPTDCHVPANDETPIIDSRPNARATGGISYGSDMLPEARSVPSPKKTPFWNEDRTSAENRKKVRQAREAEWDVSLYKENQQKKRADTFVEKKKDLQMLIDYKPWGKPGAGAPRNEHNNRRTKKMELKELERGEEMQTFIKFGQPGNGAPLRTSSGTVITNLKANNDIRFKSDVKGLSKAVENGTRYKTTRLKGEEYHNQLADLAQKRKIEEGKQRKHELQEEKKTWEYDPYGKPGAGAPIKTESGNLKIGRKKTLVKDGYEMREVEFKITNRDRKRRESLGEPLNDNNETGYEPWGKGAGAPRYDSKGSLNNRFKWSNPNTVQEYQDPSVTWATLHTKSDGGGGLVVDEKGERKTKFAQTLVVDKATGGIANGAYRTSEALAQEPQVTNDPSMFNPWGKPGAGAPMTDSKGNIVAANRGKAYMDKMGIQPAKSAEVKAKQEYLHTLKDEMIGQQQLRSKEEAELKRPGNEVASWIRSKEIGYPKRDPNTGNLLPEHYRGTSDVTQHQMDIRRPKQLPGMDDLRSSLEKQAAERHSHLQAEKQLSRATSVKHHETFDTFWNKPGAGAPKTDTRRLNLDMETHAQGGHMDQPPWKQPAAAPNVQQRWVRTKAVEKRFEPPSNAQSTQSYEVRAPWAVF